MKRIIAVVAASLLGFGCAASPPEDEAVAVRVQDQGTTPTVTRNYKNCQPPDREGAYDCTNQSAEWGFNEGSFLLLADIDAWGDQKVLVENRGEADVEIFIAQGFDKKEGFITLHRWDTLLVSRRDEVWPVYGLFMNTSASQGGAMVRLKLR